MKYRSAGTASGGLPATVRAETDKTAKYKSIKQGNISCGYIPCNQGDITT